MRAVVATSRNVTILLKVEVGKRCMAQHALVGSGAHIVVGLYNVCWQHIVLSILGILAKQAFVLFHHGIFRGLL